MLVLARLATVALLILAVVLNPFSTTQTTARDSEIIVPVDELGGSGTSGEVKFTDNGDGTTTIDVQVSGATGDHPAALLSGTCADLEAVIALLTEVDAAGSSVTDVPFELSALQDPHLGPHAVAIYRSADENASVIACSDIPLVPVEPIQLIAAEVVEIIDAQRLLVEIEGEEHTVVLIGVDAPTASECYGDLAKARLKRLARKGTVVRLEADEIAEDAEGNLLRYVWIDRNDERQLLNRELIEEGYAAFKPDKDNGRHDEELEEAERAAIEGNKRIWSKCGGPHQSISGAEPATPSAP